MAARRLDPVGPEVCLAGHSGMPRHSGVSTPRGRCRGLSARGVSHIRKSRPSVGQDIVNRVSTEFTQCLAFISLLGSMSFLGCSWPLEKPLDIQVLRNAVPSDARGISWQRSADSVHVTFECDRQFPAKEFLNALDVKFLSVNYRKSGSQVYRFGDRQWSGHFLGPDPAVPYIHTLSAVWTSGDNTTMVVAVLEYRSVASMPPPKWPRVPLLHVQMALGRNPKKVRTVSSS